MLFRMRLLKFYV